jgi:hypothetical protein
VQRLLDEMPGPLTEETGVTVTAVAERLHLDRSTASRRVRVAVTRGYLKNLETRKGRPARLRVGDPLPGQVVVLPPPEALLEGGEGGTIPPADASHSHTPGDQTEAGCDGVRGQQGGSITPPPPADPPPSDPEPESGPADPEPPEPPREEWDEFAQRRAIRDEALRRKREDEEFWRQVEELDRSPRYTAPPLRFRPGVRR